MPPTPPISQRVSFRRHLGCWVLQMEHLFSLAQAYANLNNIFLAEPHQGLSIKLASLDLPIDAGNTEADFGTHSSTAAGWPLSAPHGPLLPPPAGTTTAPSPTTRLPGTASLRGWPLPAVTPVSHRHVPRSRNGNLTL